MQGVSVMNLDQQHMYGYAFRIRPASSPPGVTLERCLPPGHLSSKSVQMFALGSSDAYRSLVAALFVQRAVAWLRLAGPNFFFYSTLVASC